jgi:hypothetical protein
LLTTLLVELVEGFSSEYTAEFAKEENSGLQIG